MVLWYCGTDGPLSPIPAKVNGIPAQLEVQARLRTTAGLYREARSRTETEEPVLMGEDKVLGFSGDGEFDPQLKV